MIFHNHDYAVVGSCLLHHLVFFERSYRLARLKHTQCQKSLKHVHIVIEIDEKKINPLCTDNFLGINLKKIMQICQFSPQKKNFICNDSKCESQIHW